MLRLDHVITYANVDDLDAHLEAYRQAGFSVADRTLRHEPGLRSGFIQFGSEHVVLMWVEDEAAFTEHSIGLTAPVLREAPRPVGVGLFAPDVDQLKAELMHRGFVLPELQPLLPPGISAGVSRNRRLLALPVEHSPGAYTFALSYPDQQPATGPAEDVIQVAPNGTYALSGITLVDADAEAFAQSWRKLLAPKRLIAGAHGNFMFSVGPHVVGVMTPGYYAGHYGRAWEPALHAFGALAIVHLLAVDVVQTAEMLKAAGRTVIPRHDETARLQTLFVEPDPRDGITFVITERAVADWQAEREASLATDSSDHHH